VTTSYGLKGFPDAITAVFPQATVQTCIVHLLRHSLDFVSWKDRKPVAAALRGIYRALDAATAEAALGAFEDSFWGQKYPTVSQNWRRAWSEVVSLYAFPGDVRRILYTTDEIDKLFRRELLSWNGTGDRAAKRIGHALIQIRRDLDDLAKRAGNIPGFQSEIDSALERVVAIEKGIIYLAPYLCFAFW